MTGVRFWVAVLGMLTVVLSLMLMLIPGFAKP